MNNQDKFECSLGCHDFDEEWNFDDWPGGCFKVCSICRKAGIYGVKGFGEHTSNIIKENDHKFVIQFDDEEHRLTIYLIKNNQESTVSRQHFVETRK